MNIDKIMERAIIDRGPFNKDHPYISTEFFVEMRAYRSQEHQDVMWVEELSSYDDERLKFAFDIIRTEPFRSFNGDTLHWFNLWRVAYEVVRRRISEEQLTQYYIDEQIDMDEFAADEYEEY